MSTDPLDARRDALVAQANETVLYLEHPAIQRWFTAIGEDAGALASRLRASATTAWDASSVARNARRDRAWTQAVLAEATSWQKLLRLHLRFAPDEPAAARAVDELRGIVARSLNRVPGALAATRAAAPRLRDHADVLGPRVEALRLADLADRLSERLAAVLRARDERAEAQLAATRDAQAAVAALRQDLREVRLLWRLAHHQSGGQMLAMNLGVARADVHGRAQRSRRGAEVVVSIRADEGDAMALEVDGSAEEIVQMGGDSG